MLNKVFFLLALGLFLSTAAKHSKSVSREARIPATVNAPAWKVLFVGAHPDDEYVASGTIYRLTQEIGAQVDEFVITEGEAGFKYSELSARLYGVNLEDEKRARELLPSLRRQELKTAGRVLQIHEHLLMKESDKYFTTDLKEAEQFWDLKGVEKKLSETLSSTQYDFLFTWLPSPKSHGAHQAAALLALRVVNAMPESKRPIVLGVSAELADQQLQQSAQNALNSNLKLEDDPVDAKAYREISDRPESKLDPAMKVWTFDREKSFGRNNQLSYQQVVSQVIAAHQSQGAFQNRYRLHRYERFRLFAGQAKNATERTDRLFSALLDEKVKRD
jgi:N-acetylglucosamine malate deacetylase 2